MKLTKPQLALLTKAVQQGQVRAVDYYPPVQKLRALGLIEPTGSLFHPNRWTPTQAGRDFVNQIKKTP